MTPKQRRWLAIVLLLLPILLIILLLIKPLIAKYLDTSEQIKTLEVQLQGYTNKIASLETVTQHAAAIKAAIKASAVVSPQQSTSLAQADIQQQIRGVIAASGAILNSTQNLAQKNIDGLIKIGINVRFTARMEALKDSLYAIESTKPYMMIEAIKILGVRGERNMHTGKIEPVDKVHISADVISYIPAS